MSAIVTYSRRRRKTSALQHSCAKPCGRVAQISGILHLGCQASFPDSIRSRDSLMARFAAFHRGSRDTAGIRLSDRVATLHSPPPDNEEITRRRGARGHSRKVAPNLVSIGWRKMGSNAPARSRDCVLRRTYVHTRGGGFSQASAHARLK